jgi:pentatricopeptide repeat protein
MENIFCDGFSITVKTLFRSVGIYGVGARHGNAKWNQNLFACAGYRSSRRIKFFHASNITTPALKQVPREQRKTPDQCSNKGFHDTDPDVISLNAMITKHAQKGRLKDARRVFDEMSKRSIVSWNAIIAGYAQNRRINDARALFDKMSERDVVSWNVMIAGYVQDGQVDDAFQLFDEMPERDVVSWNTVISGYTRYGRIEDAQQLFDEMPERNVVSWNAMMSGYVQIGRLEDAHRIFDQAPRRNVVSWTTMITGYAQNGNMERAHELFDKMPERNVVSWNAMIAGYVQNGQSEEAFKLFSKMEHFGMKRDQSTFTSVLSGCASLAAMEQGKQVHQNIIKTRFKSDVLVGNAVVTMYAKCGSIEDAQKMFDEMPERDVISWNAIIAGNAQHGNGEDALQLFEQMQKAGMKPDHITFVGVLSACNHAGLVDQGWHFFALMCQNFRITPRVEHYACMVDLLGRSGHLEEAVDLINKMHCEPHATIWGTLLGACRVHANLELAKHAAKRLLELEPQNAAAYVQLANIYASSGRWEDVANVRKLMKDRGVIKKPACSWIEINHIVHEFHVGDRSHPQMDKIYQKMERLDGQLKQMEHGVRTNFILNNAEE